MAFAFKGQENKGQRRLVSFSQKYFQFQAHLWKSHQIISYGYDFMAIWSLYLIEMGIPLIIFWLCIERVSLLMKFINKIFWNQFPLFEPNKMLLFQDRTVVSNTYFIEKNISWLTSKNMHILFCNHPQFVSMTNFPWSKIYFWPI